MNKDLIFAAGLAVALHGAVAWLGQHPHPTAIITRPHDDTHRFVILMPPEPADDIFDADDSDSSSKAPPAAIPVPSLTDDSARVAPFVVPTIATPPIPTGPVQTSIPLIPGPSGPGDGPGNGPIDWRQLSQPPAPVFEAPPIYPNEMKRSGTTGTVIVEFLVDREGMVRNPHASPATAYPDFDRAAVEALRKWRFRPGIKDGRAVVTRMQIPIVFHLGEE